MTTKTLNEIQVGDVIVSKMGKTFTEPLTVTAVQRYDRKAKAMVNEGGSVVVVKMHGGRFWPMQPGQAEVTEIVVED